MGDLGLILMVCMPVESVEMKINLDELRDGSHMRSWSGDVVNVDPDHPDAVVRAEVEAIIHRLQDLITVRGDLTGQYHRPCDRCLNDAVVSVAASLEVVIRQRGLSMDADEGDEGEYLLIASDDEVEIDLTEQIRDRIVVELPIAVHCREGCKGLCPQCGEDLNEGPCECAPGTDERWAGLRSIDLEQDRE